MQISPPQPPPTPPRRLLSNRQMWMSSWGPDNSKNHIWLPQCRQILLIGGVGWFHWEGPQSAAITHINCFLHAHFTANGTHQGGKNMWPCWAVQPWSVCWLKGEDVWFVTIIWRGLLHAQMACRPKTNPRPRAAEEGPSRRGPESLRACH